MGRSKKVTTTKNCPELRYDHVYSDALTTEENGYGRGKFRPAVSVRILGGQAIEKYS